MAVIYVGTVAFPISPNPPAGDFYLGIDTANNNRLSKQNSSGVVFDLESGLSYTDLNAVNAIKTEIASSALIPDINLNISDQVYLRNQSSGNFFRARISDLQKANINRFYQLFDDFISGTFTSNFTSYTSGTGASHQVGTYGQDAIQFAIGVLQSDTGTVANGRAALGTVSSVVFRVGVAKFYYHARHALEQLSTAANTFVFRAGFIDSLNTAGEGTNGIYFRYTHSLSSGNFEAVIRIANTEVLTIDTGVAADLNYHVFKIVLTEDGQNAYFFIDGNNVASASSPNLPSVANSFGAGFKIEKTVGTTQMNMDTDWMLFGIERSDER